MNIDEKLKEIENHFNSVTDEEFEAALIRSGHGEIRTLSESNMMLGDVK